MATLPRTAADAARWAQTSNQTYQGLCDHFVGLAYGLPHSGYASAKVHWNSIPAAQRSTDNQPPVGALVFWDTGKPAGHVAIVTAHDRAGNALVTTTHTNGGKPTTMRLSSIGMKYLGWSVPHFQGRTAELDKDSTGIYVQPDTTDRKGDRSGIDNRSDSDIALAGAKYAAGIPPDTLSWKELGQEYGYATSLMKSVPELKKLFKEAADQDYEDDKIISMIKSTKWYKTNSEYARNTILQKAAGGADWKILQADAQQAVELAATKAGAPLTADMKNSLTNRYMMEGWGKRPDGASLLSEALADAITISTEGTGVGWLQGDAGNLQEILSEIAANNGVKLSDGYFESAAQSVAKNMTTIDDWRHDIRSQAASLWPTYAEKIMAGADMKDLASGYMDSMSRILEVDKESIDLSDPYIRKAMTGVDDKGTPTQMGLYDFEINLRKDPRWLNTKNAQDKMMSIATDVAKSFGFTG